MDISAGASSHSSLKVLQAPSETPIFRRTSVARPLSEATEFDDTDFESNFDEVEESPGKSMTSMDSASITTASTPREVPTPDSGGLSNFQFHIEEESVKGPQGPHLFRASTGSDDMKTSLEVDFFLAKTPTRPVFDTSPPVPLSEPERIDTTVPCVAPESESPSQRTSIDAAVSGLSAAEVRSWTPQQVVRWMQDAGFDDTVVEKFFINDISGEILLDLQADDLKELDIHSFGKRHRLMSMIQRLRDSVASGSEGPATNQPVATDSSPRQSHPGSHTLSPDIENEKTRANGDRHSPHKSTRLENLAPGDSVSIVAIEQVLPKPHRCSKGEACPKWQKQQRKIARSTKDLPPGAKTVYANETSKATATKTAKLSTCQEPMPTPSVAASSDALGPETPHFRLSEEKLSEVSTRDPQESVRQFLNFQHLSRLQPVEDATIPPKEKGNSPASDSPASTKTSQSLTENLKQLPKLTIPNTQPSGGVGSPSTQSALRTITPSVYRRRANLGAAKAPSPAVQDSIPINLGFAYTQDMSPADAFKSPSDFYRNHDFYRQQTPLSEVDVPVTAIPNDPVGRGISQSVPPNMTYGGEHRPTVHQTVRPASTKPEGHWRRPSTNACVPTLQSVNEAVDPIDTPADLTKTSRNSPRMPDQISHSGWMKKRKTTRFLRHEWEEHLFTLRGTRLNMYDDEEDARRDSKALESIDVDDYAVACSSLASSSKLTAAFKKTVLKRNNNPSDETAFAFSLIPAPNGTFDRKTFFTNQKAHHFAVKTRDERIDWMRELMLAKALKRGKDCGDLINVNGQML
ncbi:hypothetical protein VTN31DRAFT_2900 [Thermomyces dupontii]|uniref:uncharacterized protein n=1 Tax=Talaromyces thermophilus TaxID=28565 RepID=UPI003743B5D6